MALKLLRIIVITLSLCTSLYGYAEKETSRRPVTLSKQKKDLKGHNEQLDIEGNRSPVRPIIAHISITDGFEIFKLSV